MTEILNEREYRRAKSRMGQVKIALVGTIGDLAIGLSNDVTAARRAALQAEYDKLHAKTRSYEEIKREGDKLIKHLDVNDIGLIPIVARISRALSQKDFAMLLGMKEQQVQRYESERYAGISLARYKEVLRALGVVIDASLAATEASLPPRRVHDSLHPDVLRELKRRKWLGSTELSPDSITSYLEEGLAFSGSKALNRRNVRDTQDLDQTALAFWQARVLKIAASRKTRKHFDFLDMSWLSELGKLSVLNDGPRQAQAFLDDKGIVLIVEPHLPRTGLDGAALLLQGGTPVIGLTLRYDRLDNFWFTLFHELGHIFLHLNKGLDSGFFDNIDVLDSRDLEKEADSFARSALIPDERWNSAPARFAKSLDLARAFAASCGIHESIVVGRMRRERKDYTLFREAVGEGKVRPLFLAKKGKDDARD